MKTLSPLFIRLVIIGIIILSFTLGTYGYGALHTRYLADDYCYASAFHKYGLIGSQKYWFVTWPLRYSTVLSSGLIEMIGGIGISQYLGAATLIIWVMILYWVVSGITFIVNKHANMLLSLLFSLLFVTAHLLSSPNVGQSFYWQAGRLAYTMPLLFLCFYTGLIIRHMKAGELKLPTMIIIGLLVFIAGGFADTFTLMQFVLFSGLVVLNYSYAKGMYGNRLRKILLIGLIASALSLVIIFFQPGNEVRRASLPATPGILYSSLLWFGYSLYYFTFSLLTNFFVYVLVMIFSAIVFIRGGLNNRAIAIINHFSNKDYMVIFGLLFVLPILAAISLPAFAIYQILPDRALALLNFFIITAFAAAGCVVGVKNSERILWARKSGHNSAWVVIIFVAMAVIQAGPTYTFITQRQNFDNYVKNWRTRHNTIIIRQKNDDIVIPALGNTYGLEDISEDPSHWVNTCFAEFYGVKSVRAKKTDNYGTNQ